MKASSALPRVGVLFFCLSSLFLAGKYALGVCSDGSCSVTADSAAAAVTAPTGSCPSLTVGHSYTVSSSHTFIANKTSGNNLSCSMNWTATLRTDEGVSQSLNVQHNNVATLNGSCGPVSFGDSISRTYTVPVSGSYNVNAETAGGGKSDLDPFCFTASP